MKDNLEKQLESLNLDEKTVEYPMKVEPDKLHHVVILGHPGAGKTAIARHLALKHQVKEHLNNYLPLTSLYFLCSASSRRSTMQLIGASV